MSGLKLSTANISPTDAASLTSIFCAFKFTKFTVAYKYSIHIVDLKSPKLNIFSHSCLN